LFRSEDAMGLKTPLYDTHVREGAKLVDFGGWDMPLTYGSQLDEHHAVRRAAGVFDVSHMGLLDLSGPRTHEFLRILLANDVAKLAAPGKGLYSCMLREDGGVLDDLIVYRRGETRYRLVVNAGTRDKDRDWISARAADYGVAVAERRDLALLAVQGPAARDYVAALLPAPQREALLGLPVFGAADLGDWFVARTGYTGEDGVEIALSADAVPALWDSLRTAGVVPVGLGARDTLRLEAGLSLYGSELDEAHDPIASGLAWTVAFEPAERRFIGRDAVERVRANAPTQLVGLLLEERGIIRRHQAVSTDRGRGETTSGGFGPTLGRSIALARVPAGSAGRVSVDIRGKPVAARIVKTPFVRHGRALIPL
jgi:aminomethyltransferase